MNNEIEEVISEINAKVEKAIKHGNPIVLTGVPGCGKLNYINNKFKEMCDNTVIITTDYVTEKGLFRCIHENLDKSIIFDTDIRSMNLLKGVMDNHEFKNALAFTVTSSKDHEIDMTPIVSRFVKIDFNTTLNKR